jgi:hypothetical protein
MSDYTDLRDWCVPMGDDFITVRAIRWHLGRSGSGWVYTVEAGFRFDVSIPVWAQWAFDPKDERYLKAACLHDHMLENGWSRVTAGAEFHEALRADGVGRIRRKLMWLAVSLFKHD